MGTLQANTRLVPISLFNTVALSSFFLYPQTSQAGLLDPVLVMPWLPVFWVLWAQALLAVLIWMYRSMRALVIPSLGVDPTINSSFLSETIDEEPEEQSEILVPPAPPDEWSLGLIGRLEWRVFEKLCIRLSRIKGNSVEENIANRGIGVDFYLLAKDTNYRIGAVKCKNWHGKPIDLEPLVELQRAVNTEKLHVGLLMYHGELSENAEAFLARPEVSIKVRNSQQILEQIFALDEKIRAKLLARTVKGAYTTPSCPNCDVKLEMKIGEATGVKFMVCPNAPACVYSMSARKAPVLKVS